MSDTWHSWDYTPQGGGQGQVQTFEFGLAQNELDAGNRIAKYLGVDVLDPQSTLTPTNGPSVLSETMPENPPPNPEPEPTPEPTPDPEPDPTPAP